MTYYEVLGVPENATPDQIKKQYRRLSLEHHPDRPNGSDAKFKEINEAYETLSNDTKREIYDSTGMSANEQSNYQQAGGVFGGFNPFGFAFGKSKAAADMRSFEDILKEFE